MLYYVIDTNVLIDYPDIIPDDDSRPPENPTIDLNEAHIVVPSAVVRELSSFKKERSERGHAARIVLKRIRKIVENHAEKGADFSVAENYAISEIVLDSTYNRFISVVPVHKNFKKCLPYCPSEDDMDGQIILTALSVAFTLGGLPVDGTAEVNQVSTFVPKGVVLLTNDNGLATRAYERGLKTSRYSYKTPPVYTGRRDLIVPFELFQDFINSHGLPRNCIHGISRYEWERQMPDEPPLVANEFIIMRPENGQMPTGYDINDDPYFLNIGRFDEGSDSIVGLEYATGFPVAIKNAGQAIYAEALMHPDIDVVICTGPAGSGKTYMATIYALEACRRDEFVKNSKKRFIETLVVPCQIEDDGVGYLPGDLEEKLDPNVQPIKNAIRNFLLENDRDVRKQLNDPQKSVKARLDDLVDLTWANWFSSIAIAYARGRDFNRVIALFDEFQDQNRTQADTLLKRLGQGGKIIITGDIEQIHSAYLDRDNNGLTYARELVKGAPMVAQVTFTEDENVRSPFVKFLVKRQAK